MGDVHSDDIKNQNQNQREREREREMLKMWRLAMWKLKGRASMNRNELQDEWVEWMQDHIYVCIKSYTIQPMIPLDTSVQSSDLSE